MHHGQTKKIDLVWFGCPGLYRFALDYFGLLWFTLFWLRKCLESSIPWTMDKHKRKKNINGVGYRVAAQLKILNGFPKKLKNVHFDIYF